MLIKNISLLLLFTFICGFAYSKDNQKIFLECTNNPCIPEKVISEFLYTKKVFSKGDVTVIVKQNNQETFRESLKKYITNYWIPHEGYGMYKSKYSVIGTAVKSSNRWSIAAFDSSLNCEFDNDYNCSDWASSPYFGDYVLELDNYLRSIELRFTATREFVQGNESARAIMVSMLTSVPAARIGSYALRYSDTIIPRSLLAESLIYTSIGQFFSLKSNLEPGDILVFKNGKLTIIKLTGVTYHYDTPPNVAGNTSGGTGGDGGSTNPPPPLGSGGLCTTTHSVCTGGGCTTWTEVNPCEMHP